MLPEWFVVVGLLIGAAIGSFLNVVIYRLPRGMSLANPPNSFCPECRHRLGVADLFPLFSWLLSRGRCRHCGKPVPSRYFFVELITGGLWAGITWQYLIAGWEPLRAFVFAVTAAALVAIIYIDWELYIIPDELNAALLVTGLGYRAIEGSWLQGLYGALAGWGIIWGIQLLGRLAFGKDAMGDGDVKMMRGVGFVLGPTLVTAAIGLAVPLGLIGGVAGILYERARMRNSPPPAAEDDQDAAYEPTPVWAVFYLGFIYLCCLDVIALLSKGVRQAIERPLPKSLLEDEEDDWEPSATTIPFGPYLAAGCLICILFANAVQKGIRIYVESIAGEPEIAANSNVWVEPTVWGIGDRNAVPNWREIAFKSPGFANFSGTSRGYIPSHDAGRAGRTTHES